MKLQSGVKAEKVGKFLSSRVTYTIGKTKFCEKIDFVK